VPREEQKTREIRCAVLGHEQKLEALSKIGGRRASWAKGAPMTRSTKPIPEGLQSLTPQLVVPDARAAIAFFERAFGAELPFPPMTSADGKTVMHAHVRIGDSVLFLSDAGGFAKRTTSNVFLYLPDVDAAVAKAAAAGAKVLAPVTDMFWGDRWGMLEDPFGNVWQLATHVEDVAPDEMQRRMASLPKAG
jgi:PhnB protein